MTFFELILIAVALSMDAFAVSVCKGICSIKRSISTAVIVGLYFGIFQAIMPLLGYYLGDSIHQYVEAYSGYVACFILSCIGYVMIKNAIKADDGENKEDEANLSIAPLAMISAAIATSIDAFAVGVVFSTLEINLYSSVAIIGLTTFIISFIGVRIGSLFNDKLQKKAEIIGGVTLIIIGIKILIFG